MLKTWSSEGRGPTCCGTNGVACGCWAGRGSDVCMIIACTCWTWNACVNSAGTTGGNVSSSSWTTRSPGWQTCSGRWTRTTTDSFPGISSRTALLIRVSGGNLLPVGWLFNPRPHFQNSTQRKWRWEPLPICLTRTARAWSIGRSSSQLCGQIGRRGNRPTIPRRSTTKWNDWLCSVLVARSSGCSKWERESTGWVAVKEEDDFWEPWTWPRIILSVWRLTETAPGPYPEEHCDGARRRRMGCVRRVLGEERSLPRWVLRCPFNY